mmetsp:Transcript_18070/g.42903  ORF Transcript_18070/g.42903 Transcript_18070/m.42903 type:complete len:307 (-) Transcript_18070:830-1750(-)
MGDARPLQGLLQERPLQLAHQGRPGRAGAGCADRHEDRGHLRCTGGGGVRLDAGGLRHAERAAAGLELLHPCRRDDHDGPTRSPAVPDRQQQPVLRRAHCGLGLPAWRLAASFGEARVGGGRAAPAGQDEPHRGAHRARPQRRAPLQPRPADRRGGHLRRGGRIERRRPSLLAALGRLVLSRPAAQRRARWRGRGALQARGRQGRLQGRADQQRALDHARGAELEAALARAHRQGDGRHRRGRRHIHRHGAHRRAGAHRLHRDAAAVPDRLTIGVRLLLSDPLRAAPRPLARPRALRPQAPERAAE